MEESDLSENRMLWVPESSEDQNFGETYTLEAYLPSQTAQDRSASPGFFKWTPIIGVKPKNNRHTLATERHIDPKNPVFVWIDKLLGKKSKKPLRPSVSYNKPKPTYGPSKPTYGPPKPTYDPPKPAYGPPKQEGTVHTIWFQCI